jgi:broad specificity phosphatase PhoE
LFQVELVAHMDAGDRTRWQDDQDLRPLSELGRRQAKAVCALLVASPVDGLFSSPTLRCCQTLEPLARATDQKIEALAGLREAGGFPRPAGWGSFFVPESAYGGARVAGAAYGALAGIRDKMPEGRVVICSHGDVVPALVAFLGGLHDAPVPEPRPQRPMWYTLEFEGAGPRVSLQPTPPGFP